MFKLDSEIIAHRLFGVSFAFLTDSEISELSVVDVRNPITFDALDNPIPHGLHDKKMGVSPFDHSGTCVTCGLTSVHCPGHHGHIQLVAPLYNPFLIKDLYRLLKAKCFHCHRLRIADSKIQIFITTLKLIKAGEIIGAQRIKQYFHSLIKDVFSNQKYQKNDQSIDNKKVEKIHQILKRIMYQNPNDYPDKGKKLTQDEVKNELKHFYKRYNIEKEKIENQIMEMIADVEDNEESKLASCGPTSIIQKMKLDLIKEIWSQVQTTKCPNCKKNSPSVRRDGYTKLFIKPLSGRMKNTADQRKRLNSETVASSNTGKSRRASSTAIGEDDESEDFDEVDKQLENENLEQLGLLDDEIEEEFKEGSEQKFITVAEVKAQIEKTWNVEHELLNLLFGKYEPESDQISKLEVTSLGSQIFFINKILVQPTRFRPESEGNGGGASSGGSNKAYLHAHSAMLLKIIKSNLGLKDAILDLNKSDENVDTKQNKLGNSTQKWIQLQEAVNCFMDSSMASKNQDKDSGGIRQLLEKKEGMFRMKMMGKRVNYGGRSVISPDPYITTDQIGVPVFMARKLTFPESVSRFNENLLKQAVINGPTVHPGANMVENEETGELIHLEALTQDQRMGIARLLGNGTKIVYRHLRNGDPLLVNRQPTLHKPSIMAHRCRVLPTQQTIRMHYANCNTYNADFDGDEMNIHLPQSYQAHAEAYGLMATHKQYCVPTSGKPIRGLIQDSVVSGVFMTSKDTFLSKEQYNQLVYIGLRELIEMDKISKITTLPPAILKPRPLWTGKQVISTLLKNIVDKEQEYKAYNLTGLNVSFKSKLSAKEWGPIGKEEGEVVFRDNEHLRGTLDKNAFGASEYGLVHAFYEVYGSEKAGELLTSLARVFTVFLQTYGFTCGLDDLMISKSFNKKRREAIESGHAEGIKAAAEFCGLKDSYKVDSKMNWSGRVIHQSKENFDQDVEDLTKQVLMKNSFSLDKKCIQLDNPIRKSLENKMSTAAGNDMLMLDAEIDSIMQGKMNDATSNVLKEIIPDGLVKRFPQNNLSAMVMTGAKGGVVNQTQISVLLGQQSLEGRRVPKMQNGKTLPSFVPFDPNPRSSGYISDRFITGLRPQDFYFHCMAGREGLIDTAVKTSRSGYLQRCLIKQLESLIVNYDMTVRDNDGSIVQFIYGDDGIDVCTAKYLDKFDFLEYNFNSLITSGSDIISKVNSDAVPEYKKQARRQAKQLKKENPNLSSKEAISLCQDPLVSLFHPQRYFGAISDSMSDKVDGYTKNSCQFIKYDKEKEHVLKRKFAPIEPETFKKMYYMKYMKSLVHAGENVGTIAAQSVGEPSTQMTLNTFHLAGHGAGNMTLGIPRLKEILMTTPYNIKTPIMKIFFKKNCSLTMEQLQKFSNKFLKIKLNDIVRKIDVSQQIHKSANYQLSRKYRIELTFDDKEALNNNLSINQLSLAKLFSDSFIPVLMSEVFKQLKKSDETNNQVQKVQTKLPVDHDNQDNEMTNDIAKGDEDSSEEDQEIMKEINQEIDGKMKISKDVRGYEEDDDQQDLVSVSPLSEDPDSAISEIDLTLVKKKTRADSFEEGKTKNVNTIEYFTKVQREIHSRYTRFLSLIDFNVSLNRATVEICLPIDFKKVLMLTLAEQALSKVLVRSVTNIEKCTLVKPKKESEEAHLVVQGINFDAFYPHQDIIDINRIETNHSYAMRGKYGVEAMRANIMKEVQMVFGVYGISVDTRHLSLISDFMTFNGEYRAFNRIGIEQSSSPFLKMSYETTLKYLVSSSQTNETDDMSAPSSAIVMGQVPRVGTGMFDLLHI